MCCDAGAAAMTWFLIVERILRCRPLRTRRNSPSGRQVAAQAIGVDVAGVSRCGPVAVAGRARQGGVLIAGLVGDLVGQALELALGHRVCGDLSGGLHVARRDHTALDVDGDGHLTVRSGGLGTHAVSNFRSWTVNPQCMGRTGHGA